MSSQKIKMTLPKLSKIKLITALFLMPFLSCLALAQESRSNTGVSIKQAQLIQQDNTVFLKANINYQFNPKVTEALNNGITLTFNVKLSIVNKRPWLWNKHIYTVTLPYHIKYHTLAATYQITDLATQHQQSFASLSAAIYALGTLKEVPLHKLPVDYLKKPNHIVMLSAYLNIEALPLPMRPLAYITPAWHLSSSYQWPLP